MSNKNILSEVPDMGYEEASKDVDHQAFIDIVESRRSVRVYTDEPIPEEVVQQCLDLALLAPNSSNLQAWEFYWVRSEENKAKMVEACLSQPAAKTAAEIIVSVARTNTWQKHAKQMVEMFQEQEKQGRTIPKSAYDYYQKIVNVVYRVGWFNALAPFKWLFFNTLGLFRPMPRGPVGKNGMKIWAVKSAALACENLMLAFRAFGYDTCPMEGLDSARVKKILKLPSDAVVVMAISAGKRDAKGIYGPRVRFPREQFIKEV